MKVLHVLPSLDQKYGGPIRAVLDLSARGIRLGLEAEVLGFGDMAVPDNPFPLDRIHQCQVWLSRGYRYSPDLNGWLKKHLTDFDGVVLHGMWLYPNYMVSRVCRHVGIPYICFPHGMLEPWAIHGQGLSKAVKKVLYWHLRERRIFRNASAVFFTTIRERMLAKRTFNLHGSSFVVVPYGVDSLPESFAQGERSDLTLPENLRAALFLGRIQPKKNVDFLLRSWAHAKMGPEWRLVIAGPGEPDYLSTLQRLAMQLGISSQVRFVGFVSGADKAYLLRSASWFLLPSKQENFGVAVLEAIAAGCPVAISDQVFLSDHLHRESEVLPLDMRLWARFLHDRMPDEQHRQRVIQLDERLVIPMFMMENVAADWVRSIEDVFSKLRPITQRD